MFQKTEYIHNNNQHKCKRELNKGRVNRDTCRRGKSYCKWSCRKTDSNWNR